MAGPLPFHLIILRHGISVSHNYPEVPVLDKSKSMEATISFRLFLHFRRGTGREW